MRCGIGLNGWGGGRCSQCDLFVERQRPHVVNGCKETYMYSQLAEAF